MLYWKTEMHILIFFILGLWIFIHSARHLRIYPIEGRRDFIGIYTSKKTPGWRLKKTQCCMAVERKESLRNQGQKGRRNQQSAVEEANTPKYKSQEGQMLLCLVKYKDGTVLRDLELEKTLEKILAREVERGQRWRCQRWDGNEERGKWQCTPLQFSGYSEKKRPWGNNSPSLLVKSCVNLRKLLNALSSYSSLK